MARFILENFLPVRVHVRDQKEDFQRYADMYDAHWTPTLLVLDPDGAERYRLEGFLPVNDMIAQLELGLGHESFQRKDWAEAERRFAAVVNDHADTDAAAEATYWAGVSRYKQDHDPATLTQIAETFSRKYRDTAWAKKASVWAKA